jgi:hypothetical protein
MVVIAKRVIVRRNTVSAFKWASCVIQLIANALTVKILRKNWKTG